MLTGQESARLWKDSFDAMSGVRESYSKILAEFRGRWWNRVGDIEKRYPRNPIAQQAGVYLPALTGRRMHVRAIGYGAGMEVEEELKGLMLTRALQRMRYPMTDRRIVQAAMFSGLGCAKIGVMASRQAVSVGDRALDPGEFFVKYVSPYRLGIDPTAGDIRQAMQIGDEYLIDRAALIADIEQQAQGGDGELKKAIDRLMALKPVGDDGGGSDVIGIKKPTRDNTPGDLCRVVDVCIYDKEGPRVGMLPPIGGDEAYIFEPTPAPVPDRGIYELLTLIDVPESAIGMGPSQQIMEIALTLRDAASKLDRQIRDTKRNFGYSTDEEEIEELRDAPNEQWIRFSGTPPVEIKSGGMTPELEAATRMMDEMLNESAASLQLTGGKEDIGKTATGTAILDARANAQFSDMRESCQEFRARICEVLSWFDDHAVEPQNVATIGPGGAVDLTVPPNRTFTYDQFCYEVDTVTAQTLDPTTRIARTSEAIQAIGATAQIVAALGGDVRELVSTLGRASGDPAMRRIFPNNGGALMQQMQQQAAMQQGAPPQGGAPVRSPRPAPSRAARDRMPAGR